MIKNESIFKASVDERTFSLILAEIFYTVYRLICLCIIMLKFIMYSAVVTRCPEAPTGIISY